VAAVAAAGGVPVLLPPVPSPDAARRAVAGIDGLLLTGGADVAPSRYGAEPPTAPGDLRPDRDAWEPDLLAAALARDLPVLAICRGAQILAVATGGTLHQHVPDLVGHSGHRPGAAVLGTTPVRLAAGSLAARILGGEVKVPCYHHQAIDRLGGVEAVGWADDGIVEAVELPDRRFALGVQWHPEDGDDPRLFEALVAAAAPPATPANDD
jgi:gamma-glutamyl-gamma-aminobutyrate hydrolase PuuD